LSSQHDTLGLDAWLSVRHNSTNARVIGLSSHCSIALSPAPGSGGRGQVIG
jgi:hypothetical protein